MLNEREREIEDEDCEEEEEEEEVQVLKAGRQAYVIYLFNYKYI